MSLADPGISVVVPTFNRTEYIDPLLASLQHAAKAYNGPSEILLIDDSDPMQAAVIRGLCEHYGAVYISGSASVREKRNTGILRSQFPIIMFIDSDCEATPTLFVQHGRTYAEADMSIGGVVGVTEFPGENSWTWQAIQRTQFLNAFSFARRMEFAPWATCSNVSYRRTVLDEVDGFDTNLPFKLGGEDSDLGIRVNKAGYRIKCNQNAIVLHAQGTWDSLPAICRRTFLWGRTDVHLYYLKHKEKLGVGSPKLSQILVGLVLVSTLAALLSGSFRPLVMPILWIVTTIVLQAVITVAIEKESWRYLLHEIVADALGFSFELGTLLEGLRRLEFSVLYKTVFRGPVLPTFAQQEWNVQTWCMWIGIFVVLLMQGV